MKNNHIWVIEENSSGDFRPLHQTFSTLNNAKIDRNRWIENFPMHKFRIKKYVSV